MRQFRRSRNHITYADTFTIPWPRLIISWDKRDSTVFKNQKVKSALLITYHDVRFVCFILAMLLSINRVNLVKKKPVKPIVGRSLKLIITFSSSRIPDISNGMERVSIGPNVEIQRNKSHSYEQGNSRVRYSAQDSMSDH